MDIYRCRPFADALGLRPDQNDIACEFAQIYNGNFLMGTTKAE